MQWWLKQESPAFRHGECQDIDVGDILHYSRACTDQTYVCDKIDRKGIINNGIYFSDGQHVSDIPDADQKIVVYTCNPEGIDPADGSCSVTIALFSKTERHAPANR